MPSANLMNIKFIKTKHISLQHPNSFKYFDNNNLAAPRSLVLDGAISYGGSSGYGITLIHKAFGEYWERNHFQTSVRITSKKRINQITPVAHRDKLLTLCHPTNEEQLHQHLFSFTTVYNLFDERPFDYFYNSISLHTLKEDALYLGMTDSIACASHPSKKQALYHSLIEFLERQSLVGSWISKHYRYSVNPSILGQITPYTTLFEALSTNGDLSIFEIGNRLPGYNIIIFYFAHCSEDIVQYAVGSKSGLSLSEAINSAFDELYQTYTMLYQTNSSSRQFENKAGASYHMSFPQFNTRETQHIIPYFNQRTGHDINSLDDLTSLPQITLSDALLSLKQISTDIFYYHHYEKDLKLHFTKILSYDFFAHMSLKNDLSLEGIYAKKLNITQENAYLAPLPFP